MRAFLSHFVIRLVAQAKILYFLWFTFLLIFFFHFFLLHNSVIYFVHTIMLLLLLLLLSSFYLYFFIVVPQLCAIQPRLSVQNLCFFSLSQTCGTNAWNFVRLMTEYMCVQSLWKKAPTLIFMLEHSVKKNEKCWWIYAWIQSINYEGFKK